MARIPHGRFFSFLSDLRGGVISHGIRWLGGGVVVQKLLRASRNPMLVPRAGEGGKRRGRGVENPYAL